MSTAPPDPDDQREDRLRAHAEEPAEGDERDHGAADDVPREHSEQAAEGE